MLRTRSTHSFKDLAKADRSVEAVALVVDVEDQSGLEMAVEIWSQTRIGTAMVADLPLLSQCHAYIEGEVTGFISQNPEPSTLKTLNPEHVICTGGAMMSSRLCFAQQKLQVQNKLCTSCLALQTLHFMLCVSWLSGGGGAGGGERERKEGQQITATSNHSAVICMTKTSRHVESCQLV